MRLFRKEEPESEKHYCSKCKARAFVIRKIMTGEVIGYYCSKGRCGNRVMLETEVQ